MKCLWFCLFLAACHSSDGGSAPLPDGSSGPVDDAGDANPGQGRDAGVRDSGARDSGRPTDGAMPGAIDPDYRVKGTIDVAIKMDSFKGTTCTFAYESFAPATTKTDVTVVIAPGFALSPGLGSSRDALRTLATHIASFGIAAYTVDLCTNGGSIDHPKNGAAIAEFGDKVGGKRVIYSGFSAGGLDALIAAAQASNIEAFLALDAVDANDLAKGALDSLKKPVHAMSGEPSMCNSSSNMLTQYKGRSLRVVKVNKAQHFTFEGAVCQGIKCLACNGGGEPEATAVRALATSYVLGISGVDPNGLSWWEEGSAAFKALSTGGVVSSVQ